MTLTPDDLEAIRSLLSTEFLTRSEFADFQEEFTAFRAETQQNFDALFKLNETRELEYLAIAHQLGELEKKVA